MARILTVDDEPQVRRLIRLALEGAGHEVDEAADGAQALSRIRRQRPDLVLLDNDMPSLRGLEVARHLANDPTTATIPIVLVSGDLRPDDPDAPTRVGIHARLPKPFSIGELLACVAGILGR